MHSFNLQSSCNRGLVDTPIEFFVQIYLRFWGGLVAPSALGNDSTNVVSNLTSSHFSHQHLQLQQAGSRHRISGVSLWTDRSKDQEGTLSGKLVVAQHQPKDLRLALSKSLVEFGKRCRAQNHRHPPFSGFPSNNGPLFSGFPSSNGPSFNGPPSNNGPPFSGFPFNNGPWFNGFPSGNGPSYNNGGSYPQSYPINPQYAAPYPLP